MIPRLLSNKNNNFDAHNQCQVKVNNSPQGDMIKIANIRIKTYLDITLIVLNSDS